MKQFAVFGLGRFGYTVALSLTREGAEVIAVDSDMRLVEQIKDSVAQAICMDATDENALRTLGIEGVEAVIVAIGDNQQVSILSTALLRDLHIPMIIARATSPLHGKILERIGAHRVVYPENQMAEQVAKSLMASDVIEHIALKDGQGMAEIQAYPEFFDQTIAEIDFRKRFNLLIVGIRRNVPKVMDDGKSVYETELVSLPWPDEEILEGDVLVVVGKDDDIVRLTEYGKRK